MPGDAALEVAIAAKRYGARPVLHDVHFRAGAGEVLALLGASGTGKSTTLRIAMGLDTAFEGHVHRPPGRLGVVFQEPWLSTADNLRLVADGAPVAELLAEVGLAGAEAVMPRALSLGMARRAALARALAVRPTLLVLDEPFASLDPESAAVVARLLRRAARRDRTLVLLTTHGLDPVLGLADRLLLLAGTPASLVGDCPTPAPAEAAEVAGGDLRRQLLTRFPFLRGEIAPEAAS